LCPAGRAMNMMIAGPRRVGGVLVLATLLAMAQGYAPRGVALGQAPARRVACGPRVRASERGGSAPPRPVLVHRRAAVLPLLGGAFGGALVLGGAEPARALVKGVAPPEGYGKKKDMSTTSDGKKITNKQDALEVGREREAALFNKDGGKTIYKTEEGDRFRDDVEGDGEEVGEGSVVSIKFRVLRLGKRSNDGLSGEASLVFSFGYGEDDDKESDLLTITVGEDALIPALESAIYGMKEGGKRRISVRPERGWRRGDANCGGRDIGKTVDVGTAIGLPGALVTETESCVDNSRVPGPKTFQVLRPSFAALPARCCQCSAPTNFYSCLHQVWRERESDIERKRGKEREREKASERERGREGGIERGGGVWGVGRRRESCTGASGRVADVCRCMNAGQAQAVATL